METDTITYMVGGEWGRAIQLFQSINVWLYAMEKDIYNHKMEMLSLYPPKLKVYYVNMQQQIVLSKLLTKKCAYDYHFCVLLVQVGVTQIPLWSLTPDLYQWKQHYQHKTENWVTIGTYGTGSVTPAAGVLYADAKPTPLTASLAWTSSF